MYRDYKGNDRLVTNNADAMHFCNCFGEIELRNSYMEGLLDNKNSSTNYCSI